MRVGFTTLAAVLAAAALLVTAAPATAREQKLFPLLRSGLGAQPSTGGGIVAGDRFVTRSAVMAWNRRWNTLTLYLLWRRNVTCQTLRRIASNPGHMIEVRLASTPRISLGVVPKPQVAFMTVFRNQDVPPHIAGLTEGATVTLTRIDSYPGGVWHGTFKVPERAYADKKVYGYDGSFAARWCVLRR